MIYKSNSKAVSKLFQFSLLLLLITSIKSEFKLQNLKPLSDMIINYYTMPSSIFKSTLKLALVQFFQYGIDYIKEDQLIYQGSNKETIDTLESYVKILNFSENSSADEKYLKIIYKYLEDLLEGKEAIEAEKISDNAKDLVKKAEEYIRNNVDKLTETIKDYNITQPANIENSSEYSQASSGNSNRGKYKSDNRPPFPILHVIALCVMIFVILLTVWLIIKKRRINRQNISYIPQSDTI